MERRQRGIALLQDIPVPDEPQRPPILRRQLIVPALEPFTDVVHEHLGAVGFAARAFTLPVEVVVPQEQLLEVEAAQERLGGLPLLLDADQDTAIDRQVIVRAGELRALPAEQLITDDADLLGVREAVADATATAVAASSSVHSKALVWSERISVPHLGQGIGRSKMMVSNMPILI